MYLVQIASVLIAFIVGQFFNVLALVPVGVVSIILILTMAVGAKQDLPITIWEIALGIVCLTAGYLIGAFADFIGHVHDFARKIHEPSDETIEKDWIERFY
jgi:hypothetical protein